MVIPVVESRHHWTPQNDRRACHVESVQVGHDAVRLHAGESFVPLGVGLLVVPQKQIHEMTQFKKPFLRSISAGFNTGVKTFDLRRLEERKREAELGHWFAARKRHSAARRLVERFVSHNLGDHIGDSHLSADNLNGLRRAFRSARAAPFAHCPHQNMPPVSQDVSALDASLETASAPNALRRNERHLRFLLQGLGVMAPNTPQRTPLQEYRGPYTRPVMNRETLNIEHQSFFHPQILHVTPHNAWAVRETSLSITG